MTVLCWRAGVIGMAMAVGFVPLARLALAHGSALPLPLQALVGLWTDIAGIAQMPLLPLFAWAALGVLVGALVTSPPARGAPWPWWTLGLVGSLMTWAGAWATSWSLGADVLSRQHPAARWNLLEIGGRGLLLVGLGPLLVALLPRGVQAVIRSLGQASLWAYVFHIPFCYGRFGRAWRGQFSTWEALPWVIALIAASYGVVRLRRWSFGWRSNRSTPFPVAGDRASRLFKLRG